MLQVLIWIIKLTITEINGSSKDAEDIFQNAILVIYKKTQNRELFLTVRFITYLEAVCKKMWYRQLKRKKIIDFNALDESDESEDFICNDDNMHNIMELTEKNSLYQKHFLILRKECQILLRMFYDEIKLKKIAEYFGLKNAHQAKKKKYRCKGYLLQSIKNDPLFCEFE